MIQTKIKHELARDKSNTDYIIHIATKRPLQALKNEMTRQNLHKNTTQYHSIRQDH